MWEGLILTNKMRISADILGQASRLIDKLVPDAPMRDIFAEIDCDNEKIRVVEYAMHGSCGSPPDEVVLGEEAFGD